MVKVIMILGFLAVSVVYWGRERKGLITEKYPRDFYHVPRLLPDEPMSKNPKFIVYGDSQPGWRVKEKFLKRENWLTWKMLIFPFYELYWIGNGITGGIEALLQDSSYEYRERRMMRDAVYDESIRSNADFILNVGDYVIDGRRKSHWHRFLKENKIELPLLDEESNNFGALWLIKDLEKDPITPSAAPSSPPFKNSTNPHNSLIHSPPFPSTYHPLPISA